MTASAPSQPRRASHRGQGHVWHLLARSPPGEIRRGVSLIEVLVVILLFSFGLLGLVNLQARAAQVSISAEDSNRAALLANELAATMWTNSTVNLNPAVVTNWQSRVAASATTGLPGGLGTVAVTGTLARITVTWTPPGRPAGAQAATYMTEVLIP